MKPYQQYMCAILSNPKWMENLVTQSGYRFVSASQLADAVHHLDGFMAKNFPDGKEFDVEDFMKQSDSLPPKDADQ